MSSVTIFAAQPSAFFLSTSLFYFRKQIHNVVGHNWGAYSLEKQFCHHRNCNWNDIHNTMKQEASAGITQSRPSTTLSHFSLRCSWEMQTPCFTLLSRQCTALYSSCTTPTGNRMPQGFWDTFAYKQKADMSYSADSLPCPCSPSTGH